jgi:hypothetical protein
VPPGRSGVVDQNVKRPSGIDRNPRLLDPIRRRQIRCKAENGAKLRQSLNRFVHRIDLARTYPDFRSGAYKSRQTALTFESLSSPIIP